MKQYNLYVQSYSVQVPMENAQLTLITYYIRIATSMYEVTFRMVI